MCPSVHSWACAPLSIACNANACWIVTCWSTQHVTHWREFCLFFCYQQNTNNAAQRTKQTNKRTWSTDEQNTSSDDQTSHKLATTPCQLTPRVSYRDVRSSASMKTMFNSHSSTYTQNTAINFHFHSTSFLFLFPRVCTAFPRIKKLNSCHFSFLEGNCHASKYTSQHVIEEVWRWKSQKFSFKTLWPRQLKQWLGSFIYGEELSIATMDLCEADRN